MGEGQVIVPMVEADAASSSPAVSPVVPLGLGAGASANNPTSAPLGLGPSGPARNVERNSAELSNTQRPFGGVSHAERPFSGVSAMSTVIPAAIPAAPSPTSPASKNFSRPGAGQGKIGTLQNLKLAAAGIHVSSFLSPSPNEQSVIY